MIQKVIECMRQAGALEKRSHSCACKRVFELPMSSRHVVEKIASMLKHDHYTFAERDHVRVFTSKLDSKIVITHAASAFVVSIDDVRMHAQVIQGDHRLVIGGIQLLFRSPIHHGSLCYDDVLHAWRATLYFVHIIPQVVTDDLRESLVHHGLSVYGPMTIAHPDGEMYVVEAHTSTSYAKAWVEARSGDVHAIVEVLS